MLPDPTPANIRKVLARRDWTQKAAAERLYIAPTTLRRYLVEDGSSKLSMPMHLWELLLLKSNTHPAFEVLPRQGLGDHDPDVF